MLWNITIVFNYFCKKSILNLWVDSKYVPGFKSVRVLNICKFWWLWQGSEYVLGCNYEKFWILHNSDGQVSTCASIVQSSEFLRQGSEYVCSIFHRVLNKPPDVNTPELRIQEGCEYGRLTLCARVCLNMP